MAAFNRAGGNVLGEIAEDCKKVVVGLDFGTAYSGIAYAYRADPGTIRYGAPSAIDMQTKVPTVLVRLADGSWKFGNDAIAVYQRLLIEGDDNVNGAQLFKRFKMVLKEKTSGMDELTGFSDRGKRHSLMDLITQSLRILKEFAMNRVMDEYGRSLNITSASDVQWVLTVPAIWNDFGKAFMRRAAFKAGLITEEFTDQLMLVLEPEAASLAVQEGLLQLDLLREGNRFMVVDCGGGTIDITAHEITSVRPSLSMKAICIPAGGDWGGEKVNVNFRTFLQALLTPDNFRESELLVDYHMIYTEFDRLKMAFDPASESAGSINISLVLEARGQLVQLVEEFNKKCSPSQKINPGPMLRRGHLPLSRELMLSFFEPLLVEIVKSTHQVMQENRGITNIIVVGGFGASLAVKERIFKEFNNKNGVTCTVPDNRPRPQGAIAHGAVYQGLYKAIITHRIAPFTYGIATYGDKFRVLVTKGDELSIDHSVSITGVPVDARQAFLTWRVFRSFEAAPAKASTQVKLGELALECPPAKEGETNAQREQTAHFQFGRSEIMVKAENTLKQVRKASISMQ